MKRVALVAGFMLVGVTAFAQARGVPPSALSRSTTGPGAHFGVPASAMSMGPNGFGGQPHFSFRPDPRADRFDRDDRRRLPVVPVYVPSYYYPSPYYGYSNSSYVTPDPAPQPATDQYSNASAYDAGYSAGARAEHDRTQDAAAADRDRYGDHYLDARERRGPAPSVTVTTGAPREEARPAEPAEDLGPATVLVFKNGQQREIRNYAIIGQTLIDITAHAARKIPLADLDLPATIKANEERGSDFKLPTRG